jgi:hypothetical protein
MSISSEDERLNELRIPVAGGDGPHALLAAQSAFLGTEPVRPETAVTNSSGVTSPAAQPPETVPARARDLARAAPATVMVPVLSPRPVRCAGDSESLSRRSRWPYQPAACGPQRSDSVPVPARAGTASDSTASAFSITASARRRRHDPPRRRRRDRDNARPVQQSFKFHAGRRAAPTRARRRAPDR